MGTLLGQQPQLRRIAGVMLRWRIVQNGVMTGGHSIPYTGLIWTERRLVNRFEMRPLQIMLLSYGWLENSLISPISHNFYVRVDVLNLFEMWRLKPDSGGLHSKRIYKTESLD